VLLEVQRLTSARAFADVSFRLHAGEIVGLAGLVGSGGRELGHALIGDLPVDSGSISIDGRRASRWSPQRAMDLGVCLLPGDRKKLGLLLSWELLRNISLSSLKRYSRWNVVMPDQERRNAEAYIEQLRIVTPSAAQQVRNLSGGNQQKVVLARMLSTDARVLILDEPTQGIDVRAKEEIFGLMRTLADRGMAILFSSSEFKEIAGVADRCLVLKDGAIVAEFPRDVITEARLIEAATVSRQDAA
jgi:ribose transport system ATP-binding protein